MGALAMFLLDPDVGARRRGDLVRVIDEGRAGLEETGRKSRRAAKSMRGLRRDLVGGPSRAPWILALGGVGAAAALGAIVAYALDPNRGAERRKRARAALEDAQEKVGQQASEAVAAAKERLG